MILAAGCSTGSGRSLAPGSSAEGEVGPPPSEATCRPRSGSRLRALSWRSDEGTAVFIGWHDQKLGTSCTFQRATDGRLKCLPHGPPFFDARRFSDPDCSRPAAPVDPCQTDARLAVGMNAPSMGCGPTTVEVHALGELLPPETVHYLRQEDGRCVASEQKGNLRPVLGLVATADFVAAQEDPGPAGRFGVTGLTGEDGSRQPCGLPRSTLFDRQLGESCLIRGAPDQPVHCLPVGLLDGVSHAHSTCSSRQFASTSGPGCRDPRYIVDRSPALPTDRCGLFGPSVTAVYTAREAPPGRWQLTVKDGSYGCHPIPRDPGEKYWVAGEPVSTSRFGAATAVTWPDSARLRARSWELPGGLRQFSGYCRREDTLPPGPARGKSATGWPGSQPRKPAV